MRFEKLKTDGAARRGRLLFSNNKIIDTPAFMPVGTRASVRSVSPEEILASFMNTPGFLNQPFYRNLILKLAIEIKQAYDKKNTSI